MNDAFSSIYYYKLIKKWKIVNVFNWILYSHREMIYLRKYLI